MAADNVCLINKALRRSSGELSKQWDFYTRLFRSYTIRSNADSQVYGAKLQQMLHIAHYMYISAPCGQCILIVIYSCIIWIAKKVIYCGFFRLLWANNLIVFILFLCGCIYVSFRQNCPNLSTGPKKASPIWNSLLWKFSFNRSLFIIGFALFNTSLRLPRRWVSFY